MNMLTFSFVVFGTLLLADPQEMHTSCPPENADNLALSNANIINTENTDTSSDEVKKQLDRGRNKGINDAIAAAEENSAEIANSFETTFEATSATSLAVFNNYHHTCPYSWYWLYKQSWAYYFPKTKTYCWSYYNIWVTSCKNKHCEVKYNNHWYFYYYYRCFPEWRSIFFPARCVTFTDGQTPVWTTKWIVRYVPRGCCCKRFWRYKTLTQFCPVP